MKLKLVHFLPAIAWFVVATFLLLLPGNDLPEAGFFNFPNRDKLVHVVFFFLITYLFSVPFKNSLYEPSRKKKWVAVISLYSIAYGIIIEIIQKYFVPNRSYDSWDILADTAGTLVACLYCIYHIKKA